MKKSLIQGLMAAAVLAASPLAVAEDIDLFVAQTPAEAGTRPDVLIILDNTANWNTAFNNEMAALVATFDALPLDKFNIGLMFFGDPQVGYVRAAIRPMDATNRPLYSAMIDNLHNVADSGNARTLARTFSEAYRYLKGMQTVNNATITSPHNVKRDYTANTAGNNFDDAVHARPGNALENASDLTYTTPLDPDNCFGTYIIYIGNTVPSGNVVKDNGARNSAAGLELVAAGGDAEQMGLPFVSHQDNYADEWTRFLQENMGVVTYTIDVDPTPMPGGHGNGMGNSALLANMAHVGGGEYFRVNSSVGGGQQIADALDDILTEILAKDSVFASVSLPLAVNAQETHLNQLYVGVFRPDPNGHPRWNGNLKQYKLGILNNDLATLDADDASAINSSTGFVSECARSFWTPTTADDYWAFRPQGKCLIGDDTVNNASNTPDGPVVEKGAQAYMLRGAATRTLRTCSTASFTCAADLVDFSNASVSPTDLGLGAADTVQRNALVTWQIGSDVDDERLNLNTTEKRPSIHGDIVHSRPVAINYGTALAPQVVVFYAGNEGVLRAVNGNRGSDDPEDGKIGTVPAGGELWGFVPREFFPQIKRLRDNDEVYKFLGNPDPAAQPKPVGLDGTITAYVDADNTWLFAPARRGGRFVYAFDVTTIDSPTSPTLLWKKGCPNAGDDIDCSGGFSELGQTWSALKTLKTGFSPAMLIMGGGYDPCEDTDPHSCAAGTKGDKVYVLDAATGNVLKEFDTDRGVVADVFVVPDVATGLAKFAYAVDLGGNIYRISGKDTDPDGTIIPFGSTDPATWTITKVADLGCADDSSCPSNRKFMFSPDVVEQNANGVYHILVGSGDREKPVIGYDDAYQVDNFFFMVKDVPADPLWLDGECDGTDVICLDSLLAITGSANPLATDLAEKKGWYLSLADHEQVVTSAITVFGTVTFSTHTPYVPGVGSCASQLGDARVYNVAFQNAASRNGTDERSQEVPGGGLSPSPVAGMVKLDGDGPIVPFIVGADPDSSIQGRLPVAPSEADLPKSLTYWYIEK